MRDSRRHISRFTKQDSTQNMNQKVNTDTPENNYISYLTKRSVSSFKINELI